MNKPEFNISLHEGDQGWVVTLRIDGKLEFNGSPYTTVDKALTKCSEKIAEIVKGENVLRDKLLKAFPNHEQNSQRKN